MSSTPVPRVRESFDRRQSGGLRQLQLVQSAGLQATRRSMEGRPKSPNVRVTEDTPRSMFSRFQDNVLDRLPRRRTDAPSPPLAPVHGAEASAPAMPPPALARTAPSEFPGTPVRPQTARSNYSTRSNYDTDAETQSVGGRRPMKFQEWWKRPELKTRVIILFVWTILLLVVVSLYLGLAINRHLATQELHVALILIILISAMFFCHSLIRLCVIATRPYHQDRRLSSSSNMNLHGIAYFGPLGYAQPTHPIPIHEVPGQATATLLEDSEDPAKKIPPPPPAYGLWRQSVRVNPNQFFWVRRTDEHNQQLQRNGSQEDVQMAPPNSQGDGSVNRSQESIVASSQVSAAASQPTIREEEEVEERRPPSYASADRVHFEQSAHQMMQQYEQAAYLTRLPLHPSERGRVGSL